MQQHAGKRLLFSLAHQDLLSSPTQCSVQTALSQQGQEQKPQETATARTPPPLSGNPPTSQAEGLHFPFSLRLKSPCINLFVLAFKLRSCHIQKKLNTQGEIQYTIC